jgi:hypothetical protein
MKTTFLFLLAFIIVLSGCNSQLPEISVMEIKLNSAEGKLFKPTNKTNVPLFVILDDDENRTQNWTKTATKISQSGYRVFVTNADSLNWSNVLQQIAPKHSGLKTGILGVGKMAEQALAIAAIDTTIGAVITLDASSSFQYTQSIFAKIPPRPHLVLEATLTPQTPEKEKVHYFETCQEPKKLVWLATDLKGSNIVNSDLEQIVRRTVLMLIDRYLKGKM